MSDIHLQCDCGSVEGRLKDVSPESGNHIICYCKDCQAFARFLGKTDTVLDANGGSHIFQTPQSSIEIVRGNENIKRMRLSEKGLNRWYADCCKSPIANSMGAGSPFVGVLCHSMKSDNPLEQHIGPVKGYIFTKSAKGPLPEIIQKTGTPFFMLLNLVWKILIWKTKGLNKPSPFFGPDGQPVADAVLYDTNTQ